MKTEHYFCDQCKKEVEIKEGRALLIKICCGVGSPYTTSSYGNARFDQFHEYDLCFDCACKVGFTVKEKSQVRAPLSVEERLYEIILEIIESCKETAQ